MSPPASFDKEEVSWVVVEKVDAWAVHLTAVLITSSDSFPGFQRWRPEAGHAKFERMLRSLSDLDNYTVHTPDGEGGRVLTFLFDERQWVVRYLVVQTGGPFFLGGPRVLVSPRSFRQVDWAARRFEVAGVATRVCRPADLFYRTSFRMGGAPLYPGMLVADNDNALADAGESVDRHLRSIQEVRGYRVQGKDELIGYLEDAIIDDETWEVRYLVVDASEWCFGQPALLQPRCASHINWEENKVCIDMTRREVREQLT